MYMKNVTEEVEFLKQNLGFTAGIAPALDYARQTCT